MRDLVKVQILLAMTFLCFACSLTPTKIYDSASGFSRVLQDKASRPIQIQDDTLVVDARSTFDFTMAHYPKSISLQWEDFTQKTSRYPGRLLDDLEQIQERLRVKGLHPLRPVVVIGYGVKGKGEAGRFAWMLLYLGFQDVQVVDETVLPLSSNVANPPPKANEKKWDLKIRPSLVASVEDVKAAVTSTASGDAKTYLVDVRSKAEYFQKKGLGQGYTSPDIGAVHIEWTEFFSPNGRPNLNIKNELKGIGITEKNRIIVISNQGLRSAAVTYALTTIGFANTASFIDGLPNLK